MLVQDSTYTYVLRPREPDAGYPGVPSEPRGLSFLEPRGGNFFAAAFFAFSTFSAAFFFCSELLFAGVKNLSVRIKCASQSLSHEPAEMIEQQAFPKKDELTFFPPGPIVMMFVSTWDIWLALTLAFCFSPGDESLTYKRFGYGCGAGEREIDKVSRDIWARLQSKQTRKSPEPHFKAAQIYPLPLKSLLVH